MVSAVLERLLVLFNLDDHYYGARMKVDAIESDDLKQVD